MEVWLCVRSVLMMLAVFIVLGCCCGDPRITEAGLLCSKAAANGSIVPTFVEVMREVSDNVTSRGWGKSFLASSVPPLYALAQCHGDLNTTDCLLCYADSRTRVPRCLPNPGRLYLDGCFIRYDEYDFYNETVDPIHDMVKCADANVTSQEGGGRSLFADMVEKVLRNVTGKALGVRVGGSDEDMFGMDGMKGAYALAQCWSTLSREQCRECLENATSQVRSCLPRVEGRAMNAGCFVRYSTQRFYSVPDNGGSSKLRTVIVIAFAAAAVASLLVIAVYLGYRTYSHEKQLRKGLLRLPATVTKSNLYYKYETLEKATNFFDEKRKLGQGGAGSIYKGVLSNGKVVAVKRLVFNTRQWVDDFFNEVDLISGIQHKNLVSLLGCSIEGPESLLVYEYVPNGSLDQTLFGEAKRVLTWEERIQIITETAEGLAYLHGGCGIRIIHRDIKASNILLDEDLTAKVADFGLARCVAQDKSHLTTGIAGTLGYMAPEYLVRGQLTEKADVYAFGMLVLEILSGRNSSVVAQGSISLLQSVWMHHRSNALISCVDPALEGDFPASEAANVLRIGLLCTQASAEMRPSMSQVVHMMQDNSEERRVPSPGQPPFLKPGALSFYESGRSSNTSNNTWGSRWRASGTSSIGSNEDQWRFLSGVITLALEDRVKSEEKPTAHALGSVGSATGLPADGLDVTGPSKVSAVPLNRQFWRAGNYGGGGTPPKTSVPDGQNHAHVHPMFLHSNATLHNWVFGAVAELLDNAIDEIQNGATLVLVDRTVNPRDGSSALLIQDDGGGMDPEALRRCMSFGFSDKRSKAAIGQYDDGFKTSTMRLGADVIVFSRHKDDRGYSQSIGLLSYTFLTQTGCNRIIVPMADYEFNEITRTDRTTPLYSRDHFDSNFSLPLQWSPYSTEADLLKQFDDIGSHGTKVIIYNLWMTDDRKMELDFEPDPLDIRLSGDIKKVTSKPQWKLLIEKHYRQSVASFVACVYLSILYLRLPDSFTIVLCGQAVEHHNIADDLKYIEYILYTPETGGPVSLLSNKLLQGKVVTTIGFLKEALNINIHGFNVYNKNRLILVLSCSNSRGRGVVGVLEANFIEPTHNKQDFEKTSLFQKLEVRLKEMAKEYWAYHCGLIGYHDGPKHLQSGSIADQSRAHVQNVSLTPMTLDAQTPPTNRTHKVSDAPSGNRYYQGSNLKRKASDLPEIGKEDQSEGAGTGFLFNLGHPNIETVTITETWWGDSEVNNIIEEHRKLRAKCLEYEKSEQELNGKLANLRGELENAQKEYTRLLAESRFLEQIKQDRMQR